MEELSEWLGKQLFIHSSNITFSIAILMYGQAPPELLLGSSL